MILTSHEFIAEVLNFWNYTYVGRLRYGVTR